MVQAKEQMLQLYLVLGNDALPSNRLSVLRKLQLQRTEMSQNMCAFAITRLTVCRYLSWKCPPKKKKEKKGELHGWSRENAAQLAGWEMLYEASELGIWPFLSRMLYRSAPPLNYQLLGFNIYRVPLRFDLLLRDTNTERIKERCTA